MRIEVDTESQGEGVSVGERRVSRQDVRHLRPAATAGGEKKKKQ
jgi:hypothetical protein